MVGGAHPTVDFKRVNLCQIIVVPQQWVELSFLQW